MHLTNRVGASRWKKLPEKEPIFTSLVCDYSGLSAV